MAPILGYWPIRGLAHAIKMVLHYKEVDFEDKRYAQGDPPDYSRESWYEVKFTLGLDWPNLPYYIDGDVKLTETSAIFAYLGRKYDFDGHTEQAKIRNDMIYSITMVNRYAFLDVTYSPDYEKLKGAFLEGLDGRIEKYSKFLADDEFFGGSEMVYADFCVYCLLDIWNQFEPGCVDKFVNLKAFMARIAALPTLKGFLESAAGLKKGPFNSRNATYGGKALE